MTDDFAKYRRAVTPEEAGMAFLALLAHRNTGRIIDYKHLDVLLALAVSVVAPLERREEAQR